MDKETIVDKFGNVGGVVYLPIINPINIICDMKRTLQFLIGLVAIALSSVSCSKDEMNEKNIEGKWQSTKVAYEYYEAGKLVEEGSASCVDWYHGFNFKSDGTGQHIFYESGESETYQMTWVTMGEKLMVTVDLGDQDKETMTFDIVEIKSDSMILSLVYEDTYNGVKTKEVETYYFKRI